MAPFDLIALIAGYVLGSVPFGLVLVRLAGAGDIRKVGSGNIGATNVLRTGRRGLAFATLLLDSGKGALAVFLGYWLLGPDAAKWAGIGAVIGHCFSVFLGGKGGKGVATTLGTLLAAAWPIGLACCAIWLVMAVIFRISSLAALVAIAAAPALAWLFNEQLSAHEAARFGANPPEPSWLVSYADLHPATPVSYPEMIMMGILLAILVWARHHENIGRLVRGREPRIGQKQ